MRVSAWSDCTDHAADSTRESPESSAPVLLLAAGRQIVSPRRFTKGQSLPQSYAHIQGQNTHRFVNGYRFEKHYQKFNTILQIYKLRPVVVKKFTKKSLFQKELRKN